MILFFSLLIVFFIIMIKINKTIYKMRQLRYSGYKLVDKNKYYYLIDKLFIQ